MAEEQTGSTAEIAGEIAEKKTRSSFFRRQAEQARREAGAPELTDKGTEYKSDPGLNRSALEMIKDYQGSLDLRIQKIERKLRKEGRETSPAYEKFLQLQETISLAQFAAEEKRRNPDWMKTEDDEGNEIELITQQDVDAGLFMAVQLMLKEEVKTLPANVRNRAETVQNEGLGRMRDQERTINELKRSLAGRDVDLVRMQSWEKMLRLREQYNAQFGDIPDQPSRARQWVGRQARFAGRGVWRALGISHLGLRTPESLLGPVPESRLSRLAVMMENNEIGWADVKLAKGREELESRFLASEAGREEAVGEEIPEEGTPEEENKKAQEEEEKLPDDEKKLNDTLAEMTAALINIQKELAAGRLTGEEAVKKLNELLGEVRQQGGAEAEQKEVEAAEKEIDERIDEDIKDGKPWASEIKDKAKLKTLVRELAEGKKTIGQLSNEIFPGTKNRVKRQELRRMLEQGLKDAGINQEDMKEKSLGEVERMLRNYIDQVVDNDKSLQGKKNLKKARRQLIWLAILEGAWDELKAAAKQGMNQ